MKEFCLFFVSGRFLGSNFLSIRQLHVNNNCLLLLPIVALIFYGLIIKELQGTIENNFNRRFTPCGI